jgi:tRNA(adenine34) deaminase
VSEHYQLFYEFAYNLAHLAYQEDEVPIAAVIIKDDTNELIASSYNQMKANKSSIDHAEILALKLAMARVSNERLNGFRHLNHVPCVLKQLVLQD